MDQGLPVQPIQAEALQHELFCCHCHPPLSLRDALQEAVQPGQHRGEELLIVAEKDCPDLTWEATHDSHGHSLCGPLLSQVGHPLWRGQRGCSRAVGAAIAQVARSSVSLAAGTGWLSWGRDDMLQVVIFSPHREPVCHHLLSAEWAA